MIERGYQICEFTVMAVAMLMVLDSIGMIAGAILDIIMSVII